MENRGIFYAVGVGPGDPELMTRKACAVLERCRVIAAPQTASGQMLALSIARQAVELSKKTILPLTFTMQRDEAAREASYRAAAQKIEESLSHGEDVAMVNLGDVSIYATAYYVLHFIRVDGYEVEMVPGVASFSAVAARLNESLTEMDRPLHILPGHCDLDEALSLPGTKVLMKSGRGIHEAVQALERRGLIDRAALVADCGLPTEQVYTDLRELPDGLSYFATIIVH